MIRAWEEDGAESECEYWQWGEDVYNELFNYLIFNSWVLQVPDDLWFEYVVISEENIDCEVDD